MASPTKILCNRRSARDKKLLKKRQSRVRKDQIAKEGKLKALLSV